MNNEEWKNIEGYEGLYQVSNLGRIKSLARNTRNGHCKKDKILKIRIDKNGYCTIDLYKNSKRKQYKIHRLVANEFIYNKYNKPQINHIDGNKKNNEVSNLEWCNNSENMKHAYKNNLRLTKKVLQYDLNSNFIREWNNATEVSKYYKVHVSRIERCCKNEYGCKTCKGFIWKYKKDIDYK